MKTIKVAEATNTQLDWLVAACEGVDLNDYYEAYNEPYMPTANWSQIGPIIEREYVSIGAEGNPKSPKWVASLSYTKEVTYTNGTARRFCTMRGPTPLIAAARCYVASKLGDEVEVPEELT